MVTTARMHRILTISILVTTQIASAATAVCALLAGAGYGGTVTAALVPQVVGDIAAALVTILREINDPSGAVALPAPVKPVPPKG